MVTRHPLDDELEAIKSRLTLMGGLADQRVRLAVDAFVAADRPRLREVVNGDQPINELQMDIDDQCFRLLALQQPVAVDLRAIMAASNVTENLERVGDLAVNIAETADRYLTHRPRRPLIDLPRMSRLALGMLATALAAFVFRRTTLAQAVLSQMDELDGLKNEVFRELLVDMSSDPSTIEPAIDLILIARHLERIGDHAINIADDVIFIVDGRDGRRDFRRS